ncbi:glycosyl hydrolase 115 family protein [Asticcacaulis sp. BYS171W]|uniref:Glycosyl hydrolase 115 family protein n=1 Tax=Asticcacaulis aquaticus TaxID=2984212 RepID=A0ABT5HX41_9CAUL|nr:glycosyl hydrolase 115 family protein [Asticcacaulis aquaticus]MDC7684549.1 glycosyl hydrolase 115 family protein [Asticcacaulis aquaticus]
MKRAWFFTGLVGLIAAPAFAEVVLYDGQSVAGIVYAKGRTTELAAGMLSRDLRSLTGQTPRISTDIKTCPQVCVIIGDYDSAPIKHLTQNSDIDPGRLKGEWERYGRVAVKRDGKTYLLIYGSDRRGTVYGVTDLSRELGVSPWEWWADLTPRRVTRLTVADEARLSKTPSVKYRGIFLNDEDWGLKPWAEKTYEPEVGNIGPKTYARVYELMWRLKANTLWPAMHSVTTPFYGIKDNPKVADDYAIIIGTSHAEPMMRNNLREWDEHSEGPFNFKVNRTKILDYWRSRLKETAADETIYTVGLRGIHDGPMQGAETLEARKDVLQTVIGLQRDLLKTTLKKPLTDIPQTYVLYHELQEAYDAGLKLPDDVTLMWADDNYGYIRRLSDADERQRSGGAGVYYHLSYWGRPHDYLWLGTTHPNLIHAEMSKAYALDARRAWIVNVGDIKPIEYLSEYFLDLAFDADGFVQTPRDHLKGWMTEQFGAETADEITSIMMGYYDFAFTRKPEYMGFSETEPVTPVTESDFVKPDGEKAQARIAAYADLTRRAEAVYAALPEDRKAAFFELVLYPVRGAANLNARVLNLALAALYARQGRASANLYADKARAAHQALVADTAAYNGLEKGKWRDMMDMAPRRLPVFLEPVYPQWSPSAQTGCVAAVSGGWWNDENALTFVTGQPRTRVIELFGRQAVAQNWTLKTDNGAIRISATAGALDATNGYEQRLTVSYNGGAGSGPIDIACGGKTIRIHTKLLPAPPTSDFIENDRRVIIPLASQTGKGWQKLDGLGHSGAVLRSNLALPSLTTPQGHPLIYRFSTYSAVGGKLSIVALPVHPLNPKTGVKIAVQLDDGPVQLMDFATLGRSDQWRANVLTNTAVATLPLKMLGAGVHALKLWPLDPGVVLDQAEIRLDGADKYYGIVE